MYTLQAPQLATRLTEAGASEGVASAILATLGNCTQTLEHRGPITVSLDTNNPLPYTASDWAVVDNAPLDNLAEQFPGAVLTLNTNTTYDTATGNFRGPAALRLNGPLVVNGPIMARKIVGASSVRCGKATANWSKGGGRPFVTVQECDDDTGSGAAGAALTVYLPRVGGLDPNVVENDVIQFAETRNGSYVCTSDYLDAKIGTLASWSLAAGDIPSGWAKRDSIDNAAPDGTGVDAITGNRYPRYNSTAGGTGGSTSYTPTGSLASASATFSGVTIDSATTGLTVDDFVGDSGDQVGMGDHRHYVYWTEDTVQSGGDYDIFDGIAGDMIAQGGGIHATETSIDYTTGSSPGADPTPDWRSHVHDIGHGHTVTDPGHTHTATVVAGSATFTDVTFTGDSATIEMPYIDEIPIERIDNSA